MARTLPNQATLPFHDTLTFDITIIERQGENILVFGHPAHAFAHHVQSTVDLFTFHMIDFESDVLAVRHLERETSRRSANPIFFSPSHRSTTGTRGGKGTTVALEIFADCVEFASRYFIYEVAAFFSFL